MSDELFARADGKCELCEGSDALRLFEVDDERIVVCAVCAPQLQPDAELDPLHWSCLQTAIWSDVDAVKVVSLRLLRRLASEGWAQETIDGAYLDDALLARVGNDATSDDRVQTFDSNGIELLDGDSVTLIKDLDVKGTSFVAKRGTKVTGIRLTGNPAHVEGKVNKVAIVLKTEFLKKA